MIKVKDGYAKLINTSYTGDISLVLLSNGGTIGYDVSTNTILATIGSNVASADKLKNKVKIWGLDFDGTGNVNGELKLGYSFISGGGGVDVLNTNGQWVIIGGGCCAKGWTSYIDGYNIQFRYGASHTIGMLLNSSGNISIGSSDLALTNYKLYVNGGLFSKSVKIGGAQVTDDSKNIEFLASDDSVRARISYNGNTSDGLWHFDSAYAHIAMATRSGTCLGIGTKTPSAKLHVAGAILTTDRVYTPYVFLGKDAEGIYLNTLGIAWHNSSNSYTSNLVTFTASSITLAQSTTVNGNILATGGFFKLGSSDSYVLLGGGGHKLLSGFASASSLGNYVTLGTEQTITGTKIFKTTVNVKGYDLKLTPIDSSSNDSGDIVFYYGNGQEKSRIWTSNVYTSAQGPNYRVFKEDGTELYSSRLALLSEIPTKTSQLTNDSGYVTGGPYLPLAGGTMTGVLSMKNDINPRISFIPSSGSSTLGTIYLMGGSSTAYSGIKFKFRQWSYTANSLTRLSYYEDYNLPETPARLTANASYTILTTKNTSVSGGVITINGTSITPLTSHQSLANYVTLDGNQTISGTKTFTKDITLYASSGDSPKLIFLRSTLNATSVIDWCIYDTSGDLSFRKAAGNGWEEVFRIDYDTNNSTVVGNSLAAGFVKLGSSDLYVLLGGGGHKLLSELGTSGGPYLPLSGGTMTGKINFSADPSDVIWIGATAESSGAKSFLDFFIGDDATDAFRWKTTLYKAEGNVSFTMMQLSGSNTGNATLALTGNMNASGTVTAGKFTGNLNHTLTFSAGVFTAKTYNNSTAVTVNVPTHTSHLTNNSGFLTAHLSLANYVTLNGTLTISGVKIFSALLKFTVALGTAPFTVTSTTKVTNLHADLLDGYNATDIANYGASLHPYNASATGWYKFMTLVGTTNDGMVDFIVSSAECSNLGIADYFHFEIRPSSPTRSFTYSHLNANNNWLRNNIYAYTTDNKTYTFYMRYTSAGTWDCFCRIKLISTRGATVTLHDGGAWQTGTPSGSGYLASFTGAVAYASSAGSVAWGNVTGKPTIPSVGNGTVTIKLAGSTKGSFTMNQSGNTTIELTDNNTWRGITDSYSGTDSTISLSQKGGNALYNALVNGYASSAGNADTVDNKHASDFAEAGHTHGTYHSNFTTTLANTTTDSGWSMINASYNSGFLLKSIRTQASAPGWIEGNYAAGICFGGADTKGVISCAYGSPAIRIAGGNGTKPVWWIRLVGTNKAGYNLDSMPYAVSAGTATKAVLILVHQHTDNDVDYPLIWTNASNSNSVFLDLLFKSYNHLMYNPKYRVLKTGSLLVGSTIKMYTGDSALAIYSGRITDAKSDGNICFLTSIDNTDPQSHTHPTLHGWRCNIVLQPRGGLVYIGTNPDGGNASYKLYVAGNTYATGSLYAAHFYENSDILLKLNIQEILNSDKMPIIKEFDWKEDGSHSYGLIAQELEEQGYSELVSTKDDGYKTVNYSAALSLIVGKLQVKIKELEKEIEELKNK